MPDDTGAPGAFAAIELAAPQERRGPLRPERLKSVRTRMSGAGLARLFQFGDVVALGLATLAAASLSELRQPILLGAPLLALVLLVSFGAYRMSAREPAWRRLVRVLLAALLAGAVAGFAASFVQPEAPAATLVWMAAAAPALAASHWAWSVILGSLRRRGLLTPNLIIVGATAAAERLVRRALKTREVNILGVFDDRRDRIGPTLCGVPVLGTTRDLVEHRVLPFVDRIVVTVPARANARIAQLLQRLAPIPNPIALLMDGGDAVSEARAVGRIADFSLMQISGAPRRAGYQAAKRALDLTLALGALVTLLPLFGLIALAIKLDSPGPVFFRQRRHGYMNEEIVVWKFRSMRVEATDHAAARQVTADDDRVTRVGRFIRRTSLDELPQILNVISGEMSLVGPRPHAIGMLTGGAEASKLVETYAHRHRIKPGLTGWAAVNGSRGPVDTPEAIRRRIALDLEYVERQSFWLDLAIILKTAPCLLGDGEAVR